MLTYIKFKIKGKCKYIFNENFNDNVMGPTSSISSSEPNVDETCTSILDIYSEFVVNICFIYFLIE